MDKYESILSEEQELQNKFRENIAKIREEIATRARAQKLYRFLRKTKYNPFSEEQQQKFREELKQIKDKLGENYYMFYDYNRNQLMHLYMAYNILRKKEPVMPTKKSYSIEKLAEIVKKYKVE